MDGFVDVIVGDLSPLFTSLGRKLLIARTCPSKSATYPNRAVNVTPASSAPSPSI